jgi:hypothetical protein
MPRGDGTGPAGMGPMTGRAAGYCAGYSVPGYMNPMGGRMGMGWGRGWGRGRGWSVPYGAPAGPAPFQPAAYGSSPYAPAYSKEQEKDMLQNQVKAMEEQMEAIRKRIEEIDAEE